MFNRDQRLAVYFLVAIVVFAATAWLGYGAVDMLVRNQRKQVAARLIAVELQALLSLATQAETGQRGFVITGKEEYLEPYHNARQRLPESLQMLRRNLSSPAQLERIDLIERLQAEKMDELASSIRVRRDAGFDEAQKIVLSDQGRRLMDAIKTNVRAMEQVETAQLEQRITQSAQSAEQAFVTIAAAGAINVGLLVVLMLAVRADSKARERAALQVQELNQALEQRVKVRTGELAEVNAKLLDANRSLEGFSYTVAHDLRAPLRGMQGFAEAVLEDYGSVLDKTGQDFLQRISSGATRMEELIADLLEYSRLARSDLPLEKVRLQEVASEVLARLQSSIAENHAQLHIGSDLPVVIGNWLACAQVIQNLLANAIKFKREGAIPMVTLKVEERSAGAVRIWVCDNGIGISAQHQERIFAPFERLHSVEEYAGSGIGLAIVAKAVARMHGTCGVESEPGRGSRFWFELPVATH
jgi:signal transduction histidine kinase